MFDESPSVYGVSTNQEAACIITVSNVNWPSYSLHWPSSRGLLPWCEKLGQAINGHYLLELELCPQHTWEK